ncbi:MAG: 3'-5' exonuclease domain-containing protein 2 [Bacteroidales bacterium]|nr:3'-5' exonuclease domain-containing protein 2 [Bacteroidales bacterium]
MNGSFQNDSKKGRGINGHFQTEISKDEVNQLDIKAYTGKITVVEDSAAVNDCIKQIRKSSIIGFDTESRPSFKKNQNFGVSLIQIATENEVFLFRINLTGFQQSIIKLFENPSILKVGVSIHDDIARLKQLKNFNAKGFIELQQLTDEYGIHCNSLKKLTAIVLGFRVSKAQQLSNWEATKLSDAQARYASTDAWVGLEIYNKLLTVEANGTV